MFPRICIMLLRMIPSTLSALQHKKKDNGRGYPHPPSLFYNTIRREGERISPCTLSALQEEEKEIRWGRIHPLCFTTQEEKERGYPHSPSLFPSTHSALQHNKKRRREDIPMLPLCFTTQEEEKERGWGRIHPLFFQHKK